ncbi:hypothetical protein COLO4_03927 [Corchorus olitorius]|uniref:Uncharacterized protein n=1 Tax=Corchorus olitorius TaxID=93759 RepID=A0A1R3KW45_9ROSI|nr:hypothetical protein COLO4_03927 [Corchorus olitorius]
MEKQGAPTMHFQLVSVDSKHIHARIIPHFHAPTPSRNPTELDKSNSHSS